MQKIKDEPVIAATLAMLGSLIGLLAVFGVEISQEQKEAILTFAGTVLVLAALLRSRVTPNHKVGTHV